MSGRPRGTQRAGETRVSRYEYPEVKEPRTPETGHTPLLGDEHVVTVPLDGHKWSRSLDLARIPADGEELVVIDLDPAVDPVLLWCGKRNRREVPVLPLQRNEVVAASRIARIVDRSRASMSRDSSYGQPSLFEDLEKEFREVDKEKRVEFYTHDEGWKNKLICGDSLAVMESMLEYEGLREGVQAVYFDPPYGVKYDGNFQQRVDATENQKDDLADDVLTIKAFRDTWSLGVHSYLSYLQDGYRKAVQLRHVVETLLDAMAFFQSLDTRLVGPPAPSLRWAVAELPDSDPEFAKPSRWYVTRPLGLDAFEPFLPDIACRDTERRTAQWPPADRTLDVRARQARKEVPYAVAREVRHVLIKDGVVVGYSGLQPELHGASAWVERRRQVWQDLRKGSRYFIRHDGHEIDLQCNGHERVSARLSDGRDTLADLPEATNGGLDMGLLQMVEDYPDLYLRMRRPPSVSRRR